MIVIWEITLESKDLCNNSIFLLLALMLVVMCHSMSRNMGVVRNKLDMAMLKLPFIHCQLLVSNSNAAFDLVDPYLRTTHSYKYLLTAICYFSRYPEAIPLKKLMSVLLPNLWWNCSVIKIYLLRY